MKVCTRKPNNLRRGPLPRTRQHNGKLKYELRGGPWAGASAFLSSGSTAVLTAKGLHGRYVEVGAGRVLEWEPIKR